MAHVDEETLQIRKGMGQTAVENLREWLSRRDKTRDEALSGITLFFHESDVAATYAEMVLKLPDGALPREVELALEAEVMAQWTKRVASWDAVSQLSVSTHNEDRSWEPYWLYNEQVWVRGLVNPGHFGMIEGKGLGLGKTGFAVRLMAPTIRAKRHVLTNIRLHRHPAGDQVHEVTKLSEILRLGIHLMRQGINWIAYLDEVNFFFSRRDANKKESKDVEKFLRLVRKLGGSVVFITHLGEGDVPEVIKPFLTSRFEKLAKPRMRVEIRSPEFKIFRRINSIPDASKEDGWEYDTNAKAGLEIDVDIAHMTSWVNGHSPSTSWEEDDLILRFLDERPSKDDEMPRERAPSERDDTVDPYEAIIEEIRANPETYRKANGKVDVDAVLGEFPQLGMKKAYELGRRAKARGWGAG